MYFSYLAPANNPLLFLYQNASITQLVMCFTYLASCVGPLMCDVTGEVVDSVAVLGCAGSIPPDASIIECVLDDVTIFDCE